MQNSSMKVIASFGLKTIPFQQSYEGLEIKCGSLLMDQTCNGKTQQAPVFVRIYKTLFDHYAIVYRNELIPSTAVYISLKNCQVYKGDKDDIKVIPDNLEGTKITFKVAEAFDVDKWVEALTPTCNVISDSLYQSFTPPSSPVIPKSPTMPPLPEVEES